MNKVPVNIEITALTAKWGLVTVCNADGSINREYRISGDDTRKVVRGNRVIPPGCTEEEWFSGRVIVTGRPCNPGQAVINPDGTLVVNHGIEEMNGRVNVSLTVIKRSEWELSDRVYVASYAADRINHDLQRMRRVV